MTNIKDLFKARDDAFKEGTKAILENSMHVLDGAIEFLGISQEANNGNLVWEDVSLFEDGGEGFVMFVGVVSYEPGDLASLPSGDTVNVTAETAEYFRRVFRVGVPYELVVEGTTEEVVDYFSEMELMEGDENDDTESLADLGGNGFDLEDLSDEQREALCLFTGTAGSGSNS